MFSATDRLIFEQEDHNYTSFSKIIFFKTIKHHFIFNVISQFSILFNSFININFFPANTNRYKPLFFSLQS